MHRSYVDDRIMISYIALSVLKSMILIANCFGIESCLKVPSEFLLNGYKTAGGREQI